MIRSYIFLFSFTKIGRIRQPVKDRYAISEENLLSSFLVRYFLLKFLACRSAMLSGMFQEKRKKMGFAVQGVGGCYSADMPQGAVRRMPAQRERRVMSRPKAWPNGRRHAERRGPKGMVQRER